MSNHFNILSLRQQGMTLIELAVVLLILITLATVALRSTTNLQEQARWEQTVNRYEAIKAAIIGDPDLMVNGQPDISGFVSDTGRLPACLQELWEPGYCTDNTFCNSGSCTGTWTDVGYNWNGPYLETSQNPSEDDAFVDGWGHTGDGNYGWSVNYLTTLSNPTTDISLAAVYQLQSIGCDVCNNSVYTDDYPDDATAIRQTDWQVNLNTGISVIINLPHSGLCSAATCSNPAYTDGSSCSANSATWSCDDNSSLTKFVCEGIPANWSEPGKTNCETSGKTWSSTSHTLQMTVTHQGSGSLVSSTSTTPTTLSENGQFQFIQFNFVTNTFIPMGKNLIEIQKSGIDFQHAGIQYSFYPDQLFQTIHW